MFRPRVETAGCVRRRSASAAQVASADCFNETGSRLLVLDLAAHQPTTWLTGVTEPRESHQFLILLLRVCLLRDARAGLLSVCAIVVSCRDRPISLLVT